MITWTRRNLWGLLALPLLLVGLGLPFAEDLYGRYVRDVPTRAVEARLGQPVQYGDTTVTMVELSRVTATDSSTDQPVTLPPGYSFWRARLHFVTQPTSDVAAESEPGSLAGIDTVDTPGLGGCKISLEDQNGRNYLAGPTRLSGTDLYGTTGCTPSEEGVLSFDGSAYFLLPPDAEPVAVRIFLSTMLPRYLRLLPA